MHAATSEVDDAHRPIHCMDNFRFANENMWEEVAAVLGKHREITRPRKETYSSS